MTQLNKILSSDKGMYKLILNFDDFIEIQLRGIFRISNDNNNENKK